VGVASGGLASCVLRSAMRRTPSVLVLLLLPAWCGTAGAQERATADSAVVADTVRAAMPDSVRPPGAGPLAPARVPRGVADSVTVLPPVLIDDSRVKTQRSTATTERLTRSMITRFLPATTGDALISVPGVDLVKTGPWASQVSIRGLSGDRVLLMVDGVRLNTTRGHGGQSSLVPLSRLDAVEVMPGASSAEFGSDAMGGVVNLITHRSLFSDVRSGTVTLLAQTSDPGGAHDGSARVRILSPQLGAEVSAGLASADALVTPEGRVPNSGSHENDWVARGAAKLGTAVFDLEHSHHAAHDVGLPAFNQSTGSFGSYPEQARDADRFEITAPGSGWRPDLSLLSVYQDYRTGFDETTVEGLYHNGNYIGSRTTAAVDRISSRSWTFQPTVSFPRWSDLRLRGEFRKDLADGPRLTRTLVMNASGTTTSDTTRLTESVPEASLLSWAVSASAVPLQRPFRLELGTRYDQVRAEAESTATSSTPPADTRHHRLSAEAGVSRAWFGVEPYLHVASGFRVPNLDERYFNDEIHGGFRLYGNTDLRPERSVSYEGGLRALGLFSGRLREARISVFRSDVEDMISVRYVGAVFLVPHFQYFNVDRARVEGLEATTELQLGGVRIGLNAANPRGIDRNTGERLLDAGTPRVTFDVITPIPRASMLTIGARVRWNDAVRSPDSSFARPAFWTTSLELSAVHWRTRAVVAVQNLFDASYREPLSFIPEPTRTFAISLRPEFDWPFSGGSR